jgi:hypothetical protein
MKRWQALGKTLKAALSPYRHTVGNLMHLSLEVLEGKCHCHGCHGDMSRLGSLVGRCQSLENTSQSHPAGLQHRMPL